ncbi:MAG: NADH-quinone oxidoreductase subunit C [Promethearchaeota archaeon]
MSREKFTANSFSATLKSKYPVTQSGVQGNILTLTVDTGTYATLATYLKEQGFTRCLTVSAIDWLDDNEFEVYYLVHHLKNNIYTKVATRIPRKKPEIPSLATVWDTAALHEREVWELFGITAVGNPMLKPLFLEDWTGKPPLRKDFNWRDYVQKEYYKAKEG